MSQEMEQQINRRNSRASVEAEAGTLYALMRKFAINRSGAIIVIFALSLPIIIGAAGMAADVGFWYLEKRRMQEAADSGALAAAAEYGKNNAVNLTVAATNAVDRTAYDGDEVTVVAYNPPQSGLFTGQAAADGFVEVVVTRPYSTYFVSIFGLDNMTVAARAVATLGTTVMNDGSNCILALGTEDVGTPGVIVVNGNADLDMADCNIHANGDSDPAIKVSGSAKVQAGCVSTETSDPGITFNDFGTPDEYADGKKGLYVPEECILGTGVAAVDDPFDHLTWDITGVPHPPFAPVDGVPTDLEPGYYDFVALTGSNVLDGEINLAPGVYYIENGVKIHGTVTGSNVVLILVGPADADIDINATASTNISAPELSIWNPTAEDPAPIYDGAPVDPNLFASLGPSPEDWAGMLLYNTTDGTASCSKINGTSTSEFSGAIYMPTACLEVNGGSTSGDPDDCLVIIANDIAVEGDTSLSMTGCEALYGADFNTSTAVIAGLVE